jgi:VanZ family protein
MYASITIFLKQSFGNMLEKSGVDENYVMIIETFFDYFYIGLVLMTIIISLTTTVDRGIGIFIFLMCLFGILLIITMAGILSYLI